MSDLEVRVLEQRVLSGDATALEPLRRAWLRSLAAEEFAKPYLPKATDRALLVLNMRFASIQKTLTEPYEFEWKVVTKNVVISAGRPIEVENRPDIQVTHHHEDPPFGSIFGRQFGDR